MRIEPRWREILREVRRDPGRGRIAILGRAGRGKSVLAHWLAGALAADAPTGRIDADPGQGTVGPPGTVGLGRAADGGEEPLAIRFVGAMSPARHLLEAAVSVGRLADRAGVLGLERLVLDPSGFLDFPAGHAFHLHGIELFDPDHLVVMDGAALQPVLEPLARRRRPRVHHVRPSSAVVERSRADRAAFRRRRLAEALEGAEPWPLPSEVPLHSTHPWKEEELPDRLVGLLDREGFVLQVGAVQAVGDGPTVVLARRVDPEALASVAVGTVRAKIQEGRVRTYDPT